MERGFTMFVHNSQAAATPCEPGVIRRVLCYSKNQMMTEVTFEKGARGNMHAHPHEQISYIAKGSFEFTIEGNVEVVHTGDSVYIPPNAQHGTLALEDSIIVDVFTPMRDDFLK
jgi:quercetin dioxygenase-like cupin family protein